MELELNKDDRGEFTVSRSRMFSFAGRSFALLFAAGVLGAGSLARASVNASGAVVTPAVAGAAAGQIALVTTEPLARVPDKLSFPEDGQATIVQPVRVDRAIVEMMPPQQALVP